MGSGTDLVLNDYSYTIEGAGYGASNDPHRLGARFVKTLDDLSRVDPVFSNWLLTDRIKLEQVKLSDVRDNIGALVKKNAALDGFEQPDPAEGYVMQAANLPMGCPRTASISITTDHQMVYMFNLEFGSNHSGVDAKLVTYPLFKASLLALLADWPCPWATATGFKIKLRHVPDGRAIRVETESFHRPTWIGYLSAGRAEGFDPPSNLIAERTPDGGLLMMAGSGRLDSTDAAQMKSADVLTVIMAERGHEPHC